MNEFESDWISLSQSQSGGRVFLSESERSKQGVWIPQCRSWIQDGGIQDGHYHQIKWEWMSLSQNELVRIRVRVEWGCFEWIWEKITRCLNPTLQCLNLRWQNSRWLPSPSWVRMNEIESVWISLSQSQSRVRMFLSESERRKQGVWIPKCRADSKIAEFQMAAIIKLGENEWVWVRLN